MILEICAIASLVTGAISATLGVAEMAKGVYDIATAKKENVVEAEALESSGISKDIAEEMAESYNEQAHEIKRGAGIVGLLGGGLSVAGGLEGVVLYTTFMNKNATKTMLNWAYAALATMVFTTMVDIITQIKNIKEKHNAKKNARRNK